MSAARDPRRWALLAVAGLALALPACASDGHFSVLGYSTQPNYDCNLRTVRVCMFQNRTFWTVTPVPGLEMDLTQAVVREIEQKTPYKVVQEGADTELTGTIVGFTRTPLSYNQFNYPQEQETTLVVELVWRDLRTGEVLTRPARRPGQAPPPEAPMPLLAPEGATPGLRPLVVPGTPSLPSDALAAGPVEAPPPGAPPPPAPPVVVRSVAHFRPLLGESITTAQKKNVDRMAVQIVSALEKGW